MEDLLPTEREELDSRLRLLRTSHCLEAVGPVSDLSARPAAGLKTGWLKSLRKGVVNRILGRHRGQPSTGGGGYPDYDHDWAVWASAEQSDSDLQW